MLERAVLMLFAAEALSPTGFVQINTDEGWTHIPLEWNAAKRLADLADSEVRIVDERGDTYMSYKRKKPPTEAGGPS